MWNGEEPGISGWLRLKLGDLDYGFGLCASPTTHILEGVEADICPVADTFVFSLSERKWVLI
jgi:hypothetical protein